MKRLSAILLGLVVLAEAPLDAGHELSFYPSYYPQEIRIESHDPAAGAALLQKKNGLHAYVGADAFPAATPPAHVKAVASLAAYQVITFDTAAPAWRDPTARCATARALAGLGAGYVFHPYPVTPYHADYLQHADLAEAARSRYGTAASAAMGRPPHAGVRVEAVGIEELVASRATSVGGWLGPPWLKEGWFHAYLLHAATVSDPGARQAVADLYGRLTTGAYEDAVRRLNLERTLVTRLTAGCERVVIGYATRREHYSAEFSDGIENVAADSQAGLNSAIFLRTAKLKDFPWNGWLKLGVPGRSAAAWNPIAGFTDPAGRLVWWAVGDPAFFPTPQGASWIGNRVTVTAAVPVSEVPKDALLPEARTGRLRGVGAGRKSAVKVVYKVLASAFHDGTRMAMADTLYGLGFAYRWGAPGGPQHDPVVEAGTARLRQWLAGLQPVRVDATEREFGEVKFTSSVQTIEAYGRHALGDPQETASIMSPWTPVPWTLLALMEEAVKRGIAAFSAAEASRLGVPWLDLARAPALRDALAALLEELARTPHVPEALKPWVSRDEARHRWTALRSFYRKHGHFLVTSGPYRLGSWSDDAIVLDVFRDFSYPLGVGSYDRYALPGRAYVARAETRGDRLEVHADVDVIQKFQREYAIAREPLRGQPATLDARDTPVCRFVAVAPDGSVVAAGSAPYAGNGAFALDLRGLPRSGRHTVLVALYVRDNAVDAEVRILPVDRP